ncbi:MAG TPA: zf-TFIIB domain-containing protein [Gemmatimonadaceae bacterium]
MSWEPGKPSQNENEYFAKRDAEWLRQRRAELDAERKSRETAQARPTCPRGHGELTEREFKNVKIDVCSKCQGVWFDAGELEMVLHMPRADLLRAVNSVA